jgi:hypothetical protein
MTDANWGPQDQSKPTDQNQEELDLFKSRSISGYLIWLGVLYIGFQSDSLLRLGALPKRKFMPQMSVPKT